MKINPLLLNKNISVKGDNYKLDRSKFLFHSGPKFDEFYVS